jgi:hypothetical protein
MPPDIWFYTVVRIGAAVQGWKPEELERAARKCHHDASISSGGYKSPPGLECWADLTRTMITLWPPGAK